ncbi:hypothetical protein HK102_006499, partial [Quaeritorhiza haematococci]
MDGGGDGGDGGGGDGGFDFSSQVLAVGLMSTAAAAASSSGGGGGGSGGGVGHAGGDDGDGNLPGPNARGNEKFRWDDDISVKSHKRSRHRRCACIRSCYAKVPLGPRTLLYIISGCAVLATPGVLDYLFNLRKDPNISRYNSIWDINRSPAVKWTIGGFPIFTWSVFLCVLWTAFWGIRYAAYTLPEVMIRLADAFLSGVPHPNGGNGTAAEWVAHKVDYIRFMRRYILFFIFQLVTVITFDRFFTEIQSSNLFQFDGITGNSNGGNNGTNTETSSVNQPDTSWQTPARRILFSIYFFSIALTVEKLFLQIFAVNFHRNTYAERIDQNKEGFRILDKLNTSRERARKTQLQQQKAQAGAASSAPSSLAGKTNQVLSKTGNVARNIALDVGTKAARVVGTAVGIDKTVVAAQLAAQGNVSGLLAAGVPEPSAVRSRTDAVALARVLFESLRATSPRKTSPNKRGPNLNRNNRRQSGAASMLFMKKGTFSSLIENSSKSDQDTGENLPSMDGVEEDDELTIEDFEPYFRNRDESLYAFSFFDKDGNGDVSKREFRAAVLDLYNEKVDLEKSLRNTGEAVGKLDSILMVLVFAVSLFVILAIWSVNIAGILTSLAAVWIGVLFAVGGVITEAVQNLIFLFIVHAYDCGDRIEVDGESYIVKEFRMMTTVLKRLDGKEIYAPNDALSKQFIRNIRRSGPIVVRVPINVVPGATTYEQLKKLED